MCEYCEHGKPLTDKVFEDGGKFDDMMSTWITYLGYRPLLASQVKKAAFAPGIVAAHDRVLLEKSWAVDIAYCPMCGRDLRQTSNQE